MRSEKNMPQVVRGSAFEAIRAAILSPIAWSSATYAAMRDLQLGVDAADLALLIELAIWAGQTDALDCLAACECCCHEHTFERCPARAWQGCRGQHTLTWQDTEAWARHYGMSHGQFLNPGEAA